MTIDERSADARGSLPTEVAQSLKKVSAISLFVEDLQAAKSFYRDVFGVDVVFEDETSVCVKFDHLFVNLLLVSAAEEQVEPGAVRRSRLRRPGEKPSARGRPISLDSIRNFVEPATEGMSTNEYFEANEQYSMGLPAKAGAST